MTDVSRKKQSEAGSTHTLNTNPKLNGKGGFSTGSSLVGSSERLMLKENAQRNGSMSGGGGNSNLAMIQQLKQSTALDPRFQKFIENLESEHRALKDAVKTQQVQITERDIQMDQLVEELDVQINGHNVKVREMNDQMTSKESNHQAELNKVKSDNMKLLSDVNLENLRLKDELHSFERMQKKRKYGIFRGVR